MKSTPSKKSSTKSREPKPPSPNDAALRPLAERLRNQHKLSPIEVLGRLVRPTFVAPEGRVLIGADWSNIEGRVIAWLAPHESAAEKVAAFARGEDVYCLAASEIHGVPAETIKAGHKAKDPKYTEMRADGKVVELACGFGGGANAILAMADGSGVVMTRERADELKHAWRRANPWGQHFWRQVDAAARRTIQHKQPSQVGRLRFSYTAKLGGSLVLYLPDGRPLLYPRARVGAYEDKSGRYEERITFSTAEGANFIRVSTWGGKLCQGATQGTAASLLRQALVRLELRKDLRDLDAFTVLHTHDEIVLEAPEEHAERAGEILIEEMTRVPSWAEGLPIACDDGYVVGYHYSKG